MITKETTKDGGRVWTLKPFAFGIYLTQISFWVTERFEITWYK
jgi:hypothetical protein